MCCTPVLIAERLSVLRRMEATQVAHWDVCFARALVSRHQMWRWRCRCRSCKQKGRIEWKGSLCKDHIRQTATNEHRHVLCLRSRLQLRCTSLNKNHLCWHMLRTVTDFCFIPGWTADVKNSARVDDSSHVMAEKVNGWLLTSETRVRSQANLCGIYDRQISTFYEYFLVLPCQYHSTNAPYSFTDILPTLYNLSN
jgi:hypothetical protein